ncbi:hypothetical protein NOF04DRAFT_9255 [Fusarium oxysporum II5]|uniref:Uncharacterized protein n=1 Tax=Fusarium odoratissimum (strain NRRL 54006) TaxID=1089451 RepID=X0J5V1_FUSO5|nr:uncharacterized protein FOIG_10962 [Fusarium odoratissimum NRRL 54006]EXL96583.1 hypothetical protein FOIG_10962 [Fusarium odoratissimum NRRL 54006]KAK2136238.1 hypothetical protein NOF04DRAFT_9255 [Fusarium oxysporum II5]
MAGPSSQLVDWSNEYEGVWFYVPVDRDERIAELWLRIEDRGNTYTWHRNYKCLVMRTNKGRSFVLGLQSGKASKFTYQPITTLSLTDPSRMLYCRTKTRFWLGFEQATTWDQHDIGISLPNSPKSTPYKFKELNSSNAELRDVRAVAVCRNWRYSKDAGIVGMLLTYADGHQRSLGQIRLDYMEAPLTVSSGKIWLGCDKSEKKPLPNGFWPRTFKIKWVEVDKPLQDKNREYFELPLTGSLKWESHSIGDLHSVCHHESSELQNEMDQVLALELGQSAGLSGGSSDNPFDSGPARDQDLPRPGSPVVREPRMFKICGLCKFPFEERQAVIGYMDTSPLTWSDKYFPDGESYTSVSHDKGFHAACVEIVGDNLSAKGFLESCTWNILDRGFHDSFTQPPPSFVALRTGRLKSSLALELTHAISNRLPIEICERVATYSLSDKTPPGCLATSGFWSQLRQVPVNHSYERERHEDFGGRAQFLVKDAEVTSSRQHHLLPPVSWTKRRTRWIKESIAADLRRAINGGLPEEICQYIASFYMRERACLILREPWLDPNRPNCWIKSLFIGRNSSIWAQNMEVEGLRYVRSLSARRLTQQDTLVFKARYRKRGARNRPEAFLGIYYSEDHGGIREVIITEDNELPSLNMEPGLSWSISRYQNTPLQFGLRHDDIKLRFLTVAQTLEHDMRYEQRSWGVLPERFDSFPQNGDGRRRCVGQVRLDCLDLPLPVYSNNFWLGLVDMDDIEPEEFYPWHMRVTSLYLSEPVPNDNTRYIKIPFSGRLEWAVFGFASAVRQVEGGEPCDEIGQVMVGRKNVLDYASPDIKTFAVPIRGRENRS